MKNQPIIILVAGLCCSATLLAQSSDETQHVDYQQSQMSDQSISPLMMFSGDDEETPTSTTTDPRGTANRGVEVHEAASADSSSDTARGTASSLAEEGEDEGSLTLDHFRTALNQNPTATRFVIVEDEENDGVLSIQPRVAGTSKLALKKNQFDNERIIEALHELLVTRHRGASEIADSFFGDTKADAPLSAEALREILSKSDAALQKPTSSKKLTPQKVAPSSGSENEATSALDDSANINDHLSGHIRESIFTKEQAAVAIDVSIKKGEAVAKLRTIEKNQKAERRKKREAKILPSGLESDTEGYLTPGTFLKREILKTAQAEVAASLLQSPTSLPESKEVKAAKSSITKAKAALAEAEEKHIAAQTVQRRSLRTGTISLDQEVKAYDTAEEAWSKIIILYEAAIEKATKAGLDVSEIEDLNYILQEAEENIVFWTTKITEIKTSLAAIEAENQRVAAQAAIAQAAAAQAATERAELERRLELERAARREIADWKANVATAFQMARRVNTPEMWVTHVRSARAVALAARDYWNGQMTAIAAGRSSLPVTLEEATYQRNNLEQKMSLATFRGKAAESCKTDLNSR